MRIDLFTFVGMYSHALEGAAHILAKGAEHAAATGVPESEMLDWRLIADMQPLSFQFMVICNFARQWPARVAGIEVPPDVTADLDVNGFKAAIADAKAWLAARTPEEFADRDEAPLTYTMGNGMTPTLPSGRWLTTFATVNLYFHLSTAYDILRARGVQLGKADLFAGGL